MQVILKYNTTILYNGQAQNIPSMITMRLWWKAYNSSYFLFKGCAGSLTIMNSFLPSLRKAVDATVLGHASGVLLAMLPVLFLLF